MAFKNLESRFNENVNKLYAGATLKFDNGVASNGRTDAPLIVRKPGKNQVGIKLEGRSLPVVSAAQDLKRLTLFQLSRPGLLFLAKQQLLQTGNTFEFTRALNPAFVVANTVPFLHVKRNLRPLNELFGKTDTSYTNVKSMGQLQISTYNKFKSTAAPVFGEIKFNRPGVGKALTSRLLGPLNALKDTALGAISAFTPNQKRNIGELIDKWGIESWKVSRPELFKYIPGIQEQLSNYTKNSQLLSGIERLKPRPIVRPIESTVPQPILADYEGIAFIRYFSAGNVGLSTLNASEIAGGQSNMQEKLTIFKNGPQKGKKLSYIKDDANLPAKPPVDKNSKPAYRSINSNFDDPIVVSFAMGTDSPVRFRAFIKDLQQSATPEYKSYQYIGRMEKFVNYVGVQREISFKLGIIAFSKDELDGCWARINYLTGLVFPYGFNRGIFQPNIVRLTMGDVYTEQPGYVTSLNTNFNELGESWEIDDGRQVPIAAQMDIKFTIIEKTSKVADSPFYGITEKIFEVPYLPKEMAPRQLTALTQTVENRKPPVISSANIKLPTSGR
jgi:hypothetical protein